MGSVSPSSSSSHYSSHSVSLWLRLLKILSLITTPAGSSSPEAMIPMKVPPTPPRHSVGHRARPAPGPHCPGACANLDAGRLLPKETGPWTEGIHRSSGSPLCLPWAEGLGQVTPECEASMCTCPPSPRVPAGLAAHVTKPRARPILFTGPSVGWRSLA